MSDSDAKNVSFADFLKLLNEDLELSEQSWKNTRFLILVSDRKKIEQYKSFLDMPLQESLRGRNAFWNKRAEEWGMLEEEFESKYFYDFKQKYEQYIRNCVEEEENQIRRRFPEEFFPKAEDNKTKKIKHLFNFTKDVFLNDTHYEEALGLVMQLVEKDKVESKRLIPKTTNREKVKVTLYYIFSKKLLYYDINRRKLSEILHSNFEDYKDNTVDYIYKHLSDDEKELTRKIKEREESREIP